MESEREARTLLDSIPDCHRRAVLSLVHHAHRTNIKSVADELINFFKERYIVGEEMTYTAVPENKGFVKMSVSVVC